MKQLIKSILRGIGLEIHRYQPERPTSAPIADLEWFLGSVKTRGFKPRGIIDVGANMGDWTRTVHGIFPGVPAILVEPQDEMEARLTELSKSVPQCHFVKAGVGKEKGELIQTIWDDLAGSSFLPAIEQGKMAAGKQRKTPITTIDSILEQSDMRDFMPDLVKLDIQGFELEALKGANTLFGKTELFIIETSLFSFMPLQPITREVINFMAARNYEIYDITEYLRRPLDQALGQVDLAFVKADGQFRTSIEW
jgi:FkbM family methyltransferase